MSATVSVASPAVLVTVAVVDAVYSRATPGVNAPNEAGVPSVRARVAGTLPPTVPGTDVMPSPMAGARAPEPPTIGSVSVDVPTSTDTCVPAAGRIVYSRSLENTIRPSRRPAAMTVSFACMVKLRR